MSLHTLADGVFVALLQHILSRVLRRLMKAPAERLLNPIANGSWRCLDGAHDFDVRVLEYVDRFFIQDADIWCNCRKGREKPEMINIEDMWDIMLMSYSWRWETLACSQLVERRFSQCRDTLPSVVDQRSQSSSARLQTYRSSGPVH